jgi:small ligand-binding sensory domain FIST
LGALDVSLRDQLTGIDANLDDLESGVDAGSREADHIRQTSARIERLQIKALESADLLGRLVRHATELQICVRDQRAALQELRTTVARLHDEVKGSSVRARLPPVSAADRQRR